MFKTQRVSELKRSNEALRAENEALKAELETCRSGLAALEGAAKAIAAGDLEHRIVEWDAHPSPIRETVLAFNRAFDLVDAFIRESTAALDAARDGRFYRKFLATGMAGVFGRGANIINETSSAIEGERASRQKERFDLADKFESDVLSIVEEVASVADRSGQSAQACSNNANDTHQNSSTVAAAAEQATVNVQTVASAAEELSASVSEISQQVSSSSERSGLLTHSADQTLEKIGELDTASNAIGAVVDLIRDIAEQTNLLALNATIEAARAGDAGKGFAVVASEVKQLAQQTAKATDDIAEKITSIQAHTGGSVEAVKAIHQGITEISEISSAIAAATEEQTAATLEISRNVQEASTGTAEVASSIVHVSSSASETLSMTEAMGQDAAKLKSLAATLEESARNYVERMKLP